MKAFLTHRSQQVTVEGATSDSVEVLSGVPQGTVLGPLLFLQGWAVKTRGGFNLTG